MQEKQQARRLPQGDHREGDLPDEHRSTQAKAKVERRSQGYSTGYYKQIKIIILKIILTEETSLKHYHSLIQTQA